MKKKILISTGGSGGHVIPAITIYKHLENSYETLISTDIRGLAYISKNYKVLVINTPKLNNFFLLPFLSYGGSSIISTSILAGIILNLTKRKIN